MWGENVRKGNYQCSQGTLVISLPRFVPRGKRRLMEKRGVPKHLSQCWLCAILEPCESGIYPNPSGSLSLPVLLAPLLTHSCTHSLTHSCCPTTVFEKFQFHCTSLSFDIRSIQFLQPLLFVSISPRIAPTNSLRPLPSPFQICLCFSYVQHLYLS